MTNVNQAPLPRLSKAPLVRVKRRYIKYLALPFFGTKQNCQTKTKTKYRSSSEISRRVLCQTVYRTPSLQYFYGKTQTRFANCLTILLWSHVKHSRIVTTLSNSLRETKTWFAGSCNKTHLTHRIMRSVWEYGVRTLSGVYVMSVWAMASLAFSDYQNRAKQLINFCHFSLNRLLYLVYTSFIRCNIITFIFCMRQKVEYPSAVNLSTF